MYSIMFQVQKSDSIKLTLCNQDKKWQNRSFIFIMHPCLQYILLKIKNFVIVLKVRNAESSVFNIA